MKKSPLFFIVLALPFIMFLFGNQLKEDIFVLSQDNVVCEVWKGFNGDAIGNSTFNDGKFRMWINDTSGSWGLSKIGRGIMPHYWGLRYAPINEIEIKRLIVPISFDINLQISLKLIDYHNFSATNSSMNVAIVLFFDGFKTDYQNKCYQTEIQFFSYYGNSIQKGEELYLTWRNDSVAQFKLTDNLSKGIFKTYDINILPYINKMMTAYKLDHIKLKHIEIFTEAYKGYCDFEVYQCHLYIKRDLASPNILFVILFLYLLLAIFYHFVIRRL